MLSISDPGKGGASGDYYWKYYSLECIEPAYWFGTAAESFGLTDEVDQTQFGHLLAGRSPDGQRDLVQNAGSAKRDSHWDLTFSAPKSVSVLYALGAEEVRRQILEAHKCAVKMALGFMEEFAAVTRRGKGGAIHEHCATVVCAFTHNASREHDMQIHTHALVMNVGLRADGSTGSLHSVELFRHKMAMGNAYQVEFARQLTERLKVEIEPEKVGFHVKGVPKELCRENSTRRQQIEAELQAQGIQGAAASQKVAKETRVKKQPKEQAQLFEKWRNGCEAFGWGPKQAAQLVDDARRQAHESKHKGATHARTERKNAQQAKAGEQRASQSESQEKKDQSGKSQEQKTKRAGTQNGSAKQKTAHKPGGPSEKERIKAFRRHLRKAIDRIYIENQTEARVLKLAMRLAKAYGLGPDVAVKAVKESHLPIHFGLGRLEFRKLFPKAPDWNPFHDLRIPTLVFGDPVRKWGKIESKVILVKIPGFMQHELRIQQKHLFPTVPKWNPLHKITFPALRLVPKRAQWGGKVKLKEHINKSGHQFQQER